MDAEQLLKRYADGRRDFSWVDLRGVNLVGARLSGINFYRADLTGATLEHADLQGANFLKANLTNTNLTAANLSGANLRRADLTGTILTAAILDAVRFSDVVLPQGMPSISHAARQAAIHQAAQQHQEDPSPTVTPTRSRSHPRQRHLRNNSRNTSRNASELNVNAFHRASAPTIAELPLPSLALLWAGYCCFGGILGIHDVPNVLWLMVWSTALAWMLGESMAWFTPVLAAIAVMLGSGLSLWAIILAVSVSLGLGTGLLFLGWSLLKALKDSLWVGGLIVIVINLSMWLVQGDEHGVVLSGYFPLAFLLLIGMGGTGIGAIAWLQMHTDGFRRKHIAWTFGGCAALGLFCGGLFSSLILPTF